MGLEPVQRLCKRMSVMVRDVGNDGEAEYSSIDRAIV
jgi:hypothetical protein